MSLDLCRSRLRSMESFRNIHSYEFVRIWCVRVSTRLKLASLFIRFGDAAECVQKVKVSPHKTCMRIVAHLEHTRTRIAYATNEKHNRLLCVRRVRR